MGEEVDCRCLALPILSLSKVGLERVRSKKQRETLRDIVTERETETERERERERERKRQRQRDRLTDRQTKR